jgi:hypothetical protein
MNLTMCGYLIVSLRPRSWKEETYMIYLSHDLDFHVNLLVEHPVLHEASLFQLFGCVKCSVVLVRHLIHVCKCSFASETNLVVPRSAAPFLRRRWSADRGRTLCYLGKDIGLLRVS